MTPERILLSLHLETRARLDLARLPLTESRTKWINAAICQRLDRENPETIGKLDVSKLKPSSAREKTPRGPYSAKYKGTARYSLAYRENLRRIRADGRSPGIEWLIERSCIMEGKAMSQEEKDAIMEGSAPEPYKSTPMELREKAIKAARKPDFLGPWTVEYGENKTWRRLAELRMKEAKRKGEVLGLEDALEIVAKGEGVTMSEEEGREIMEAHRIKQLEVAPPVPAAKQLESAPPAAQDADFWGEDDFAKGRALVKRHTR